MLNYLQMLLVLILRLMRQSPLLETLMLISMHLKQEQIPRTEALAETASEGVSIFSYYAKGKGAYSYQALVQEVLNHA